jgi:ribosomal-protein-alanine N-acetyltransferase
MHIRCATLEDIPRIRTLEEHSPTAAHWNPAQYDALFAASSPQRFTFIAREDNEDFEIVGFLVARNLADDWEIENIVVDEHCKRRGIATALLRRLLLEAQAAGAASVILEVRESNVAARRLYESIGFRPEGRRKGYYREPVEDAILYRHSLQFCDKIC